jgi:hypothetical protein
MLIFFSMQDASVVRLYAHAPPSNDQCSGAIVIPSTGPFVYLTEAVDITGAGSTGDPALPSCQSDISRSVWYCALFFVYLCSLLTWLPCGDRFTFTPVTANQFSFSTCANTAPGTTAPDTVITIYTSASSSCSGINNQVSGRCINLTIYEFSRTFHANFLQ